MVDSDSLLVQILPLMRSNLNNTLIIAKLHGTHVLQIKVTAISEHVRYRK